MNECTPWSEFDPQWIQHPGMPSDPALGAPAPYFRRAFHLDSAPVSAVARFCGLGYGELHINGRKVSDDVLQPPFTRYDAAFLYSEYDVTACLVGGENVIGAVAGNGMYNEFARNVWDFEKAPWRHVPKVALSLRIRLADGTETVLRSGEDFRTSTGPIRSDNLYEGEIHDARLEQPGWSLPGFDDAAWTPARLSNPPGGVPRLMDMEPCRVVRRIPAVSRWEVRPGVHVYDFGVNLAGWASLRVEGPAGTTVTMRFAERLDEARGIDTRDIDIFSVAGRFQTDAYTLKGGGVEVWEPRFTYHGFQYVQVEGYPGTPPADALTACEVHTDLASRGTFSCSDDLLNRIQAAARQATVSNFVGLPTDCPHREKNGWTGDAALSAEQMLLNFDTAKGFRKWLRDLTDCQRANGQLPGIAPTGGWGYNWGSGPAWDCALVMIPWHLYVYDGDCGVLEEFYEPIRRYVDFAERRALDGLVHFGLGDWCPPVNPPDGHRCPTRVTDTAIHHTSTLTLSRIAGLLGRHEDERFYARAAARTKEAFLAAFVDKDTGRVEGDCQTSYACALYHGLVDGPVRERVFARLVDEVERCGRHIDCGILGAKYVLRVLTDGGRTDLAFAVATQRDFPSWGHWIQQGATTLWENWDGTASRNHHMFSDISGWFYAALAGINPDPAHPGFRHTDFRPQPVSGLDWAKAHHDSPCGTVSCSWRVAGAGSGTAGAASGVLEIEVSVPDGCSGTLHIPAGFENRTKVTVAGSGRIEVR